MTRLAMGHARVDRRASATSRVVSRVYRSGLLWATVTGLLVTSVTTVIVRPRVPSACSGLAGTVVAVAFLACGRGVHLLNRSGSWLLGVGLFVIQISVLGGLGVLVSEHHTGLVPLPCASAIVGSALAWTVGAVLASSQPQRIYEDPEDPNPTDAECRHDDGSLR
ncbi:cyanate permease [Cutibacterium sp. V970]|uniref:cyanate permease n=1 Tax=Cutibacterium sp. V970 TaxID=3446481 RepID=UPI003EE33C3B